jgi:hypothetical protein
MKRNTGGRGYRYKQADAMAKERRVKASRMPKKLVLQNTHGGDIDALKSDKNSACELGWMRCQERLDKISQLKRPISRQLVMVFFISPASY